MSCNRPKLVIFLDNFEFNLSKYSMGIVFGSNKIWKDSESEHVGKILSVSTSDTLPKHVFSQSDLLSSRR